jgi:hypothetical protein
MATKRSASSKEVNVADKPVLENLRLHELRFIVCECEPYYEEFCRVLNSHGYASILEFVREKDNAKALDAITAYFATPFKAHLFNGIGAEYANSKAKWYFLSWLFRDAPAQRLDPRINFVPGGTRTERKAVLPYTQIRCPAVHARLQLGLACCF